MKRKIFTLILILVIVFLAAAGFFYFRYQPAETPVYGLTYSHRYAAYLGFDPKQVYLDILNDLKPTKLRLMAYWEDIEPTRGQFNYQLMDEMLIEAQKRQIDVILVVGHKQPRWPECHHPDWYTSLSRDEQDQALINMIDQAVSHFRGFPAVKVWQVENEPFFEFGADCGKIPKDLLVREVEKVRSLDSRPIMLTDSGEFGGKWLPVANSGADIFGSTMYRTVYSDRYGYYKYPLPAAYYRIKAGVLESFTGIRRVIGVELQMEPWFTRSLNETDVSEQLALMNPKVFAANIDYADRAGFSDNYLWGVEWWYWMAQEKNDWGLWEAARHVLNQ